MRFDFDPVYPWVGSLHDIILRYFSGWCGVCGDKDKRKDNSISRNMSLTQQHL